ncbi:MAG: PHP domain-containing protein [Vulcanisaeta sp. AZ3]|jgi:predicted metal-dependent phosphoesterase TrpH|nr:MAG: hypothetical protein TU36_03250 [Vulcanisaeta sp. AZ3]
MPLQVKADLHTHSIFSDGRGDPRDIMLNALDRSIKLLSITDHNTFRGSLRAQELLKSHEFTNTELLIITGNEVRTFDGDVLVLCMEYPGMDDPPKAIPELFDWARENNCILVPVHPYDIFRHGIGDEVKRYKWPAIEVFNAGALPIFNWMSMRFARRLGIPGIANSDAHIPELVGIAYTVFELEDLSIEYTFKALLNGRIRPVPHYPSPNLLIRRLSWSVNRRLR